MHDSLGPSPLINSNGSSVGSTVYERPSLRAGIPPRYVTKSTRSTQPCIPVGSLNRVPALVGWGKCGNVTSAG